MPESRTRSARAKTAPKGATPAKGAKTAERKPRGKTAEKPVSTAAKNAAANRRADARAKTAAKTPAKPTPAKRETGPTAARIDLAVRVAKLRPGTKWSDIAAETGVAEPTLAKLRKDVRAGVFANVSPAAKRVAKDAF